MYRSYSTGIRRSTLSFDLRITRRALPRCLPTHRAFSTSLHNLIAVRGAAQRPHTEQHGDSSTGLDARDGNPPPSWTKPDRSEKLGSEQDYVSLMFGTKAATDIPPEMQKAQLAKGTRNFKSASKGPKRESVIESNRKGAMAKLPPGAVRQPRINVLRSFGEGAIRLDTEEMKPIAVTGNKGAFALNPNGDGETGIGESIRISISRNHGDTGVRGGLRERTQFRKSRDEATAEYEGVKAAEQRAHKPAYNLGPPYHSSKLSRRHLSVQDSEISQFGTQEISKELFHEQMTAAEVEDPIEESQNATFQNVEDEQADDIVDIIQPAYKDTTDTGLGGVKKLARGMGLSFNPAFDRQLKTDHTTLLRGGNIRQAMQVIETEKIERMRSITPSSGAVSSVFQQAAGMTDEAVMDPNTKERVANTEASFIDSHVYNDTEVAFSDVDELSIKIDDPTIPPGSICEILRGSNPHFGVYLMQAQGLPGIAYFLGNMGEIVQEKERNVLFVLPNFVSPAKIRDVLQATRARGEIPRDLTTPIVQEVRKFEAGCLQVYNENQTKLGTLWNLLSDEQDVTSITTFEAARPIFGKNINNMQLYATHRAMVTQKNAFSPDSRRHRNSATWSIYPQESVERNGEFAQMVREWTDSGKPQTHPVTQFVDKCRIIIDRSRQYNQDVDFLVKRRAGETVSEVEHLPDITWNEMDRRLIKVLYTEVINLNDSGSQLASLYPQILLATDRYKKDDLNGREMKLGPVCAIVFMGEIGAIHPWIDERKYQEDVALPGHHTSRSQDLVHRLFEKIDSSTNAWTTLGFQDSMADFRHDWDDLTVYCIDGPDSLEIDDGISIDRIEGLDEVWLRVHVANPSAFIPQNHWIIENAKQRGMSYYGNDTHHPMLPSSLVHGHWSLAPNRPVLTISTRVNMNTCQVLETDVRAGFIRNVRHMTYDQVDWMIGGPEQFTGLEKHITSRPNMPPWDVSIKTREVELPDNFTEKDRDNLHLIWQVTRALKTLRESKGSLMILQGGDASVKVDDGRGNKLMVQPGGHEAVCIYRGYPHIDFHMPRKNTQGSEVVTEAMLIAGASAAKWATERNLPMPFRSWQSKSTPEVMEFATKLARRAGDAKNPLDFRVSGLYELQGSTSIAADKPEPHGILGLDMYVKITSPLRRYSDLLGHYLIDSKLREIHTGQPMAVLDIKELNTQCKSIQKIERELNLTVNGSSRAWLARLFARGWHRKGFPTLFEAHIEKSANSPMESILTVVELDLYGARMHLPRSMLTHNRERGDIVWVQLHYNDKLMRSELIASLHFTYVGLKESIRSRKRRAYEAIGMEIPADLLPTADEEQPLDINPATYIPSEVPGDMIHRFEDDRIRHAVEENWSKENSGETYVYDLRHSKYTSPLLYHIAPTPPSSSSISSSPPSSSQPPSPPSSASSLPPSSSSPSSPSSSDPFNGDAPSKPPVTQRGAITGSDQYPTFHFAHDPNADVAEIMSPALILGAATEPAGTGNLSILVESETDNKHQYEDAQWVNLSFVHDDNTIPEAQQYPNPFFVGSVSGPADIPITSATLDYEDPRWVNLKFPHDGQLEPQEQQMPNPFFAASIPKLPAEISWNAQENEKATWANLEFEHDQIKALEEQRYPNPFFAGSMPIDTSISWNARENEDAKWMNLKFEHDGKVPEVEQRYPNPFFAGSVASPATVGDALDDVEVNEPVVKTESGDINVSS